MIAPYTLPNINISGIAEEHPRVVLDKRMYIVDRNVSGRGISASIISSSRLGNISTNITLVESEILANFEKRYLRFNSSIIKGFMQQIVQEESDGLERKIQSAGCDDLFALKERIPIITFIYEKVFPYHLHQKKAIITIKKRKCIQSLLEQHANIKGDSHAQSDQTDPYQRLCGQNSLLEHILPSDYPLFINTDGKRYRLIKNLSGISTGTTIVIKGTTYYFKPFGTVEEVNDAYTELLSKRIREIIVEDTSLKNLEQQLKEKLKEKNNIATIARKNNYREGDIGFIINDGKYYATLQVPDFTLQDKNGFFYAFPSCTVAVELVISKGAVTDWERPIVWDQYSHPFLSSLKKQRQRICLGPMEYSVKENIIEDCKLVDKGKTLVEHQIYIALQNSASTLLSGYFGDGIVPYNGLDMKTFQDEYSRYYSNTKYWSKRVSNNIEREENKIDSLTSLHALHPIPLSITNRWRS